MFSNDIPPPDPQTITHQRASQNKLDHLPNFSIRDYVFAARSKDIETNWPFSSKTLQFCLKHGVKDVLPPFQPLDSLTNPSCKAVKAQSHLNNHVVVKSYDDKFVKKRAEVCLDVSSCRSGENIAPRVLQKSDRTIRLPQSKNCRLIVKFGENSDHIPAEDIGSNTTSLIETMTSKVCPVCKKFSSSSNTTLNAHIDQCLSVESNPKWTEDSKVNWHRIKPRKTRLMVNIYATAPKCTIEDLDRRNGTSWATSLHLSSEGTDVSNERKTRRNPIQYEDTPGDVGAVYVDANGIKVRVLSKSNDLPSIASKGEDVGPSKPLKYGMRKKFLSAKKRKWSRKHHKYVKFGLQSKTLGLQSKTMGSHKVHNSQTSKDDHQEKESHEREYNDNVDQEKISPRNFLTRGQWVCSKRTGLAKSVKNKDGHQSMGCKLHAPRDLLFNSHHSLFTGSTMDRSHSSVDGNPCSENSERKESQFFEAEGSDKWVSSTGRMKLQNPLVVGRIYGKVNRSTALTGGSDLGKNFTSVRDNLPMKPLKTTGHHAFSQSKNVTEVHQSLGNNSDVPFISATKASRSEFSHKSTKFSESRKKCAIVNQSSVAESTSVGIKQCSGFKKSQDHLMEELDDEVHAPNSDNLINNYFANQSRKERITKKQFRGRSHIQRLRPDSSYINCSTVANKFPQEIPGIELSNEDAQEFYGNQSKISSSSLQSFEDGPFCGAEAGTGPTESNFVDRPEICCICEADNDIEWNGDYMEMELDTEVGKGEVLSEVDPISIPGPPGSFLPSPRDMDSEEYRGNSSLTSNRPQSSHDQYDGDSSAISTISNMDAARLDMQFFESFTSERHQGVEEGSKSGFSGTSIQPPTDDSALASQVTDLGAEMNTSHGENLEINRFSAEMGPMSFKTDDYPCCCKRKDRISYGIINYYDSHALKRRTTSSVTMPCAAKDMGGRVKAMPEEVFPPVLMSHAGPVSLKRDDAVKKFPSYGNGDSVSPSTSNPVLRLMGKNLLVVNKDEDASVTVGNAEPDTPNQNFIPQFPTVSGLSPGFAQNKDYHAFHHMVSQESTSFMMESHNTCNPCFNINLNNFRSQPNFKTAGVPLHDTEAMYPDQGIVSNFTREPHGHSLLGRQNIPANIFHGEPQYYPQKATAIHGGQHKRIDYVSNSRKEISIIDDIPERECDSAPAVAKSNFDLRHAKPFPYYWSPDPHVLGAAPMMYNSSFIAIPSRRTTEHPVGRSCR